MTKVILQDFLVVDSKGIYCVYGDFFIDAKEAVKTAVVSHGHGDHVTSGSHRVFCTAPTKSFMELRYKKGAARDFRVYDYGTPFRIGEIQLTFLPAGHILGSASVLMEYKGVRYLYTGDYKLQLDPTCTPISLVKADVLITESTFANPAIKHPDPSLEVSKLNTTTYPIMLGVYALGKAQRLTAIINKHCPQKKILLHHAVLPFHRIYEEHGYVDWKYLPYGRKLIKDEPENVIYMVPPLTFNSYFKAKNLIKVFASGWKRLQSKNDMELFISDHVDWDDILNTVETVDPQEIWTLHGDGKALVDYYNGSRTVKIL
ncbi:exonuclease [Olivibacter sp. XZL3]|uniref:exonuclease n=1 Tax=Olivibacter sp. XZL3 TaxID=1735116 RepID=UPI00351A68CC